VCLGKDRREERITRLNALKKNTISTALTERASLELSMKEELRLFLKLESRVLEGVGPIYSIEHEKFQTT